MVRGLRIEVPCHTGNGQQQPSTQQHKQQLQQQQKQRRAHMTPAQDAVLHSKLSAGSQGTVYAATHVATKQDIAVKVMSLDTASAAQEVAVLSRLPRHSNVVAMPAGMQAQKSRRHAWIPLERCETDLLNVLLDSGRLSPKAARLMFSQVVAAVAHCHNNSVFHLDIKPENILLVGNTPKLADFGSSMYSKASPALCTSPTGSITNSAPEVFSLTTYASGGACGFAGRPYDARAADVWSLGMLLFVMTTGHPMWVEPSMADPHFKRFVAGDYKWPADMCPRLRSLVQAMLHLDPARRISLDQVAAHAWLAADAPACDVDMDMLAAATALAQSCPLLAFPLSSDVETQYSRDSNGSITISSAGCLDMCATTSVDSCVSMSSAAGLSIQPSACRATTVRCVRPRSPSSCSPDAVMTPTPCTGATATAVGTGAGTGAGVTVTAASSPVSCASIFSFVTASPVAPDAESEDAMYQATSRRTIKRSRT